MMLLQIFGICFFFNLFNPTHCSVNVCLSSEIACSSGRCIPYKFRCNGVDNCGDNSDEHNCGPLECLISQFKCTNSGECISKQDVCDGVQHCIDKSDELHCSCGLNAKASQNKLVVGGRVTKAEDWPWMASIIKVPEMSSQCGGTLISDIYVLSAAHCFDTFTKDDLEVRLAEYDFKSTNDSLHMDFMISEIRIHEQYNSKTIEHDIAIIRLSRPSSFNSFINRACLPPSDVDLTGQYGVALGWGRVFYNGPVSNVLQIISIPVWNQKECVDIYPDYIVTPEMMCAGSKNERKTSCHGDSGGPLLVQMKPSNVWYVAGIVSWSSRCALDYHPSVFTRVSKYLQWIADNTNSWECTSSEFKCTSSRQCISKNLVCNSKFDCSDNSDEHNCAENIVTIRNKNQPSLKKCAIFEYQCGVSGYQQQQINKIGEILNGEDYEWPWMVSIGFEEKGQIRRHCGGVLINENYILTTAHCLARNEAYYVRMGVRGAQFVSSAADELDILIDDIILHSKYNSGNVTNDLGIARLSRPVEITREIQPICLPWSAISNKDLINNTATTLRWQLVQNEKEFLIQSLRINVFDSEKCSKIYNGFRSFHGEINNENILCVEDKIIEGYTCGGHSGGALVHKVNGVWTLGGILATGIGCGDPAFPTMYMPVRNHETLIWIKVIAFGESTII